MQGRHSCFRIQMDPPTRVTLQGWLHRQKTPNSLARRARAMLLLEQGQTYLHTALQVGLAECHVRKWARRFREQGIPGLFEKPRPGRVPIFSPEVTLHIVKVACERPDQVGCSLSRWDCPELARKLQADGVPKAFRLLPFDGSSVLKSSSPGSIISGCLPKCLAMKALPNSCVLWLTCILGPSPRT